MQELIDVIEDLESRINFIESQIESFSHKGFTLKYYQKKRADLITRKRSYEYEMELVKCQA